MFSPQRTKGEYVILYFKKNVIYLINIFVFFEHLQKQYPLSPNWLYPPEAGFYFQSSVQIAFLLAGICCNSNAQLLALLYRAFALICRRYVYHGSIPNFFRLFRYKLLTKKKYMRRFRRIYFESLLIISYTSSAEQFSGASMYTDFYYIFDWIWHTITHLARYLQYHHRYLFHII